jgi:inward rectifier potassium channel
LGEDFQRLHLLLILPVQHFMQMQIRINPFSRQNNDTGFSVSSSGTGGRFINRDGTYNIRRRGKFSWNRFSLYSGLLTMSSGRFVVVLLVFFLGINLLFTGIYLAIGTHELTGFLNHNYWVHVKEVFFFSTQTFTTVGYGRVNPVGDLAGLVAGLEAMMGFASFAVMTGLIYGRFARPRAYLLFSDFAVIAPFKGKTGLMFRFVNYKDNHGLTDVNVKVNLAMQVPDNGEWVNKFYQLELERNRIDNLAMNFTVVHPINEDSPLWQLSVEEMKEADVELYVTVRAFDDVYSATVQQLTSYTYNEIRAGEKFVLMYSESEDGNTTYLDLDKLNNTLAVSLPSVNASS